MRLVVKGMRCQKNCATRIQSALEAVPGVASASVSFKDKAATVQCDASVSAVELIHAVRSLDAGATKSFDAYMAGDDRSVRIVQLGVEGMSCQMNCAAKVQAALSEANGVQAATVDFEHRVATITIAPGSRITETDLIVAIESIKGKKFKASVHDPSATAPAVHETAAAPPAVTVVVHPAVETGDVTLTVVGMTCNSCANSVETALRSTDGVLSAVVNFATESAYVKFAKDKVGIRSLVEVVEAIGYEASVATGVDDSCVGREPARRGRGVEAPAVPLALLYLSDRDSHDGARQHPAS
ncbi:hypothetical protein SPRG_18589, partial [Saprolegnia parasitica CBS 223.65]